MLLYIARIIECHPNADHFVSFSVAANFQYNITSGNSSEVVYLQDQWYMSRQFTVSVLATLFILPMLMFKNIGALSYTRWAPSLQWHVR